MDDDDDDHHRSSGDHRGGAPRPTGGNEAIAAKGESRVLPAIAILVLTAIPFLLPSHVFPRAVWGFAPVVVALRNPELAAPGWRPAFLDYLYLGFTNATAFSPTDVMPLAHWAKLAMAAQAILSIVILSLVIANAVNILG